MNKFIFRGISFGNHEVTICMEAKSLDDAWEKVFIEHPECWSISFVKEATDYE